MLNIFRSTRRIKEWWDVDNNSRRQWVGVGGGVELFRCFFFLLLLDALILFAITITRVVVGS